LPEGQKDGSSEKRSSKNANEGCGSVRKKSTILNKNHLQNKKGLLLLCS
jgi:hypothetical protein